MTSASTAQITEGFTPHLGVLPQFCNDFPVTMKMREKGLASGTFVNDDFTIEDINGREVCRCKGQVMSLSHRKVFSDANGQELFVLQHKVPSLPPSYYGTAPDGQELFRVTGRWSFGISKSDITFTNAADQMAITLNIDGSWFNRSAQVTWNGRVLAQISRSFVNMTQLITDKHTYFVNCAPGVDLVLMAAICTCLDERETANKKAGSGLLGGGGL